MRTNLGWVVTVLLMGATPHVALATAPAKEKSVCQSKELTGFPATGPLATLKEQFDAHTKLELTQYLWHLSLSQKPAPITVPLLQYLANDKASESLNGYYSLVALAVGLKDPLNVEVTKWPQVSPMHPMKTDVKKLCALYRAAEGPSHD